MSVTYHKGDLLRSSAHALVNPVNCVGVSGKGLAAQFKLEYPKSQLRYENACRESRLRPGQVMIDKEQGRWIVYFPTKQHWRNPSKIQWIQEGIVDLKDKLLNRSIKTVAIPALGCGLGGLNWDDVKEAIEWQLEDCLIQCEVYPPKE